MSRVTYTDGLPPAIAEGYPFSFGVTFEDGIDARYTSAIFEIRVEANPELEAVLSGEAPTNITINHGDGTVAVSFGAVDTENLGIDVRQKKLVAELQLWDPSNLQDVIGTEVFDVVVKPGVIRRG